MQRQQLVSLLEQSGNYVLQNAGGVSQEESLVRYGEANPLNWVLGHVAFWRNTMLQMAELETVWAESHGRQYRGNPGTREPLRFDASDALTVDQLVVDIEDMQERLVAWAGRNDPVELPQHFANMLLHEAYHGGQLGMLRRLAGKEGVV